MASLNSREFRKMAAQRNKKTICNCGRIEKELIQYNTFPVHAGFILTITGFLLLAFTTPQQQARDSGLANAQQRIVK